MTQEKHIVGEKLKQQFKLDTEQASFDLPDPRSVTLRARNLATVQELISGRDQVTGASRKAGLISQYVLVCLFLLSIASLLPTAGGSSVVAKLVVPSAIILSWVIDRLE